MEKNEIIGTKPLKKCEGFMKKFWRGDFRNDLTAEKANMMSRFGVNSTFEEIVGKKIKDVQAQILQKLEFSSSEKLLNLLVPEDQKDLYERVRKHFEEKGFKTFYAGKENIEELGNNRYLFLSWDIDREKK